MIVAGTKKDKGTCTKQPTNITKFEIIILNPAILIPDHRIGYNTRSLTSAKFCLRFSTLPDANTCHPG